MKKEEMYDVIGKIDDKYIIDARSNITKKKNSWIKWGAMAACLCLAFVGAFMLQNSLGLQNKEPHLENPTTANIFEPKNNFINAKESPTGDKLPNKFI